MNREALGLLLVALLFGGVLLLARRPNSSTSLQPYSQGNIKVIPMGEEPRRYQNKETRRIEYNADGLPTVIEITRDYTIT
jgi:hypothetical protein